MRRSRSPLRGSVQQNTVRMRGRDKDGLGLLPRLGIAFGALAVVTGGGWLLWHNHWPQRQAEHVASAALHATQKAEFAIKDVVVEGRERTPKDNLSLALGVMPGDPILGFDAAAAQERIGKLPWTEAVTIERRLPDTIIVRLTERTPMARWQHDNHTVVIDMHGKELSEANPEQFTQLPLVVGAGAPAETAALLKVLREYPAVGDRVTAAVWVSDRRWDLHFNPNIVARLPAGSTADALKQLAVLVTQQSILDRDIAAIDLRVPDRLMIEPATPGAHKGNEARL